MKVWIKRMKNSSNLIVLIDSICAVQIFHLRKIWTSHRLERPILGGLKAIMINNQNHKKMNDLETLPYGTFQTMGGPNFPQMKYLNRTNLVNWRVPIFDSPSFQPSAPNQPRLNNK